MATIEKQVNADTLAENHKAISIAEFFEKNKHLLGYENLQKSLLTVVREAVDNALDACEEARILPEVYIEVLKVKNERFKVVIEDNGPGIVKKNIPNVFGKLLFGSKFHRLRQSRGQQGIGISGAVLYAQLTSGKPAKIYSRINDGKTHIYELRIDTQKNDPEIISENMVYGSGHGTRIEMEVKGRYVRGKQSVYEYLQETAIMNPFAKLVFVDPDNEKFDFARGVDELPKEPREIKPHPSGVELGVLIRMLKLTSSRNIVGFLTTEFSRIGRGTAVEICDASGIDPRITPTSLTRDEVEKMHISLGKAKIQRPPTDCLSPVGEESIVEGIKKEMEPEFVTAVSRPPNVYQGRPFQIEVGIGYGGPILDPQNSIQLMRYANKVPLLYEQSGCAITKSIIQTEWRRYGLSQSGGSLPSGPVVLTIHFASVWVPYTSEGKEAIASYPEIIKEIKLAIQEASRRLALFLGKKRRAGEALQRKTIFQRYSSEIADAISVLTDKPIEPIKASLDSLIEDKMKTMDLGDAAATTEQKPLEDESDDGEEDNGFNGDGDKDEDSE